MPKKLKQVRPLALALIWHEGRLLLSEGYDSIKNQTFYRPLGGRIEFGEYGHQTLRRELLEEIGAEIGQIRYRGMPESIFTFEGKPGHEIALLYEAVFLDAAFYERETIEGQDDHKTLFSARWLPPDTFRQGDVPLYPDALLDLIDQE
jgi:8-oxo-dGTP pyrophosphatase MutT (NUDIX family)